jgi:SAM-dependent methyltransferase
VEAVGIDPTPAQIAEAQRRGGGPRYLLGDADHLPVADASFDAVVMCLVIEHLDPFEPSIREMARVLEPRGCCLLLLNHPLLQTPGSGWIDDHILEEQYWRVGPYLRADSTIEEVAPGVNLPFMHRPLSRYVHVMGAVGLLIEDMDEPPPPPGFIARAEEYGEASTIPRLMLLRARRVQ